MSKNLKGMFLLQRRFAYVGNELALLLKERHHITSFCGYTFTRESLAFLEGEHVFTSLLLDEELHDSYKEETIDWEYLQKLEDEYGIPNLWPYIENDRIVRSGQLVREYPHNTPPHTYEEMLRILQGTARRLIDFFDREKPDFLVYYAIGAIGSFLAYAIAKKRGIKTLAILPARIGSRHVVTEHYSMFTDLESKTPSPESRQAAQKYLTEFRARPTAYTDIDSLQSKAPSRRKHLAFLYPTRLLSALTWQLTLWVQYLRLEHKSDYTTIKPWLFLFDRFRRKMRILRGYADLYDTPRPYEKYVFFPLQLEPEMTTLLYAPWFNDQLWVIKQLAKSLPIGYRLYVKEHLAMYGYRTRAFYTELKKIPNVRLIDPHTPSFNLTAHASLVATITSTVGWEALAMKKPVITFGEVFYNTLPSVKVCSTPQELPYLVRQHLQEFTHDEEALLHFIACLIETSVEVDLVDIWEKERSHRVKERRDELIPLVDLIASKITTKRD